MRARRPLALAAGLALVLTLAACGSGGEHPATTGGSTTNGAAGAGDSRTADISFAQLMIAHHRQAIEMADLALSRKSGPQVKKLAEQIKAAQDPEIAAMRSWLSAWGAPEQMASATDGTMDHSHMDMGGMSPAGMMSAEDMQRLTTAGAADFDRMWLQMMIAHHQGAVAMADQVRSTTSDDRVGKLAEAVVADQNAQIATMRTYLAG